MTHIIKNRTYAWYHTNDHPHTRTKHFYVLYKDHPGMCAYIITVHDTIIEIGYTDTCMSESRLDPKIFVPCSRQEFFNKLDQAACV